MAETIAKPAFTLCHGDHGEADRAAGFRRFPTPALQDDVTGAVDVDIDLSVLAMPPLPPLARRLLSRDWRASLSPWAVPPDVAARRQLSLTEYIDRQNTLQQA